MNSAKQTDRKMIEVFSTQTDELENLRLKLQSDDLQFGPVSAVPKGATLHFDPALVEGLLFKVLGVVAASTIPKLVEWATSVLRKKGKGEPKTVIQVGGKRVELAHGVDPKIVRAALNDLLQSEK